MEKPSDRKRNYLSVSEVAEELGINSQTVYELCKRKDFPAVRISPRRIVISLDGLAEWMRDNAGRVGK